MQQLAHPPYRWFRRVSPAILLKTAIVMASASVRRIKTRLEPDTLRISQVLIEPSKFRVYDTINADVYCVAGAHALSAEVVAYCRERGKLFVLFIASNSDLSANYQPDSHVPNPYGVPGYLCHYSIANADLIITQTQTRQHCFKNGLDGPLSQSTIRLTYPAVLLDWRKARERKRCGLANPTTSSVQKFCFG